MNGQDQTPLKRVLDKLEGVRRSGSGWKARCPAHHDPSPSLGVNIAEDGKILLRCFAGCNWRRVCEAADIDPKDLFPPKEQAVKSNGHSRRIVATYRYEDEEGRLLYEVVRFEPKGFSQRRPDSTGGYEWSLGNVRRVLYRLPGLKRELAKDPDRWVFVVEGEKDADLLWSMGFLATCNAGGAGKWTAEYAETIRGWNVVVLPDNDDPGRQHARTVLDSLSAGVAKEVRLVELPGVPEKGDVSDWSAGAPAEARKAQLKELVALAKDMPPDVELSGVPPFPVDVLPSSVRRYVEEAAKSVPVPPEMVAIPLLALAGGVIGNRAYLQLKQGWYEYPALFMMVVAGPGKNKSAAIKHARWPIKALQKDAKRIYDRAYQVYQDERARWRNIPAKERGDEPRPPKMRHYFTTDVTMERLAGMLEMSPGVSIISDELTGWVKRVNQYRQGGDREQYMSIWAAEPVKVDRQSREVYVETPVVSVFGGIQPEVVPTLHSDSQVRDGFVERLLPFLPELPPKKYRREDQISTEAYAAIAELFRAIDSLPMVDAEEDEDGRPDGYGIQMSLSAERVWAMWSDQNNEIAAELGGFLGGFYTKLEAHVARFALILHILKHAEVDPRVMVEKETMEDAIELGEFFRGQMQLFLPMLVSGAKTSTKGAGLLTRIQRFIGRYGTERELPDSRTLEPSNSRIAVCVSADRLLRGLGNVRKADITRELDSQTDQGRVFTETGNNPTIAYCVDLTKEENGIREFETSRVRELIGVTTPSDVVNGP